MPRGRERGSQRPARDQWNRLAVPRTGRGTSSLSGPACYSDARSERSEAAVGSCRSISSVVNPVHSPVATYVGGAAVPVAALDFLGGAHAPPHPSRPGVSLARCSGSSCGVIWRSDKLIMATQRARAHRVTAKHQL